eukprot:1182094-Prorocentrum_minimum.AAC.2
MLVESRVVALGVLQAARALSGTFNVCVRISRFVSIMQSHSHTVTQSHSHTATSVTQSHTTWVKAKSGAKSSSTSTRAHSSPFACSTVTQLQHISHTVPEEQIRFSPFVVAAAVAVAVATSSRPSTAKKMQ